jgi:hypothetical protein
VAGKKTKEADPSILAQFDGAMQKHFPESDTPGVLDQLLTDAGGSDGTDSNELGTEELGSLENEFADVVVLRHRQAALKESLKIVNAELDAQQWRMIEAMETQGTKQFKGMGGGGENCTVSERYDTAVDDPAAFIDWVQEHHPDMLTVNAQARNGFIRREYTNKGVDETDESFPPGISVIPKKILIVRGIKKDTAKTRS